MFLPIASLHVSYFLTDNVVVQLTPVGDGIGPPFHHWNMAKYSNAPVSSETAIWESWFPERKAKVPVQAINGRCLKCGYRLAWVLVRGKTSAELRARPINAV
jgi:hypothetical protein